MIKKITKTDNISLFFSESPAISGVQANNIYIQLNMDHLVEQLLLRLVPKRGIEPRTY